MQVLRESKGWEATPYQWATVGYMGAVETGRTICGALFAGTVFHGFLHGENQSHSPEVNDKIRKQTIDSVRGLFNGFKEQFGSTDCQALIRCDLSKKEEYKRYLEEEIYKDKCFNYVEYVLDNCIQQMNATAG